VTMVAEIDGWDEDLRVILPTAQHFRYRILATNMREFLRRRIAGSSGHAASVRLPRNSYPAPGPDRNADQGHRRHPGVSQPGCPPLILSAFVHAVLYPIGHIDPDPHGQARPG
jgi:hypothetical protein